MKSYDYANRKGSRPITWEEFATMSRQLTERLTDAQIIIGIARAGLFPATAVACSLRRELYPVRVTRRVNDEVRYATPVWRVPVPNDVAGKRVAVVDEIADTGETLALVAERVRELGAAQVTTACLVSHSWASPAPDVCALVSDAFVLFPWDQEVFMEGRWQAHPEIIAGLSAQDDDSES